MKYDRILVEQATKSRGYAWFDKGDLNVNIVSFRNPQAGHKVTNAFDDALTLTYKENGKWVFHQFDVTVDPGLKPMLNPSNRKGCAILVPNQYRSAYTIRLHGGKYEALCQRTDKKVCVYRDNTKDNIYHLDPKTIECGVFGINIHRSSLKGESNFIDAWSEGCTVFKRLKDFHLFIDILNRAKDLYGNSFTYTLI